MTRVGVATIVAGRRDHLAHQARAVGRLGGVDRYVVTAMDEDPVEVAADQVIRVAAPARGLPLARARNRAIEALGDVELAILLDVDCIPGAELVERYVEAADSLAPMSALICGPVGYLAAATATGRDPSAAERAAARGRVIRDFPSSGVRRERRAELFWSLSFAVAPDLHRELGGFDEGFVGYGAEDTDYGLRAARAGIGLWFAGGAWAYHQPHAPTPARQPQAVAANAQRFFDRWGFWPMPDVLGAMVRAGHVRWSPQARTCVPIVARSGDLAR